MNDIGGQEGAAVAAHLHHAAIITQRSVPTEHF